MRLPASDEELVGAFERACDLWDEKVAAFPEKLPPKLVGPLPDRASNRRMRRFAWPTGLTLEKIMGSVGEQKAESWPLDPAYVEFTGRYGLGLALLDHGGVLGPGASNCLALEEAGGRGFLGQPWRA